MSARLYLSETHSLVAEVLEALAHVPGEQFQPVHVLPQVFHGPNCARALDGSRYLGTYSMLPLPPC